MFPKQVMARELERALAGISAPRVLVAPLGRGEDLPFLRAPGRILSGIDVSPEAMAEVTDGDVDKREGDMADMKCYPDETFDAVVVSLFFHHYVRQGFDPFVREALRVLKPGGALISLEPNSLFPPSWPMRWGRALFGEVTGQLEDEAPFPPFRLAASLRRSGFAQVRTLGAGLCHNRTPIPIARAFNAVTAPLLGFFPLSHICWMCVFTARKPGMRQA